tara:strand:+ start:336 stop:1067 length:732 start_codon:yes stop_codon:yes gene_type:complete
MKIELIKTNKLKPATYNPRQISTKQYKDLKKSIERFGLVDPIIVNKDMTIIGGHQRYKICKELKHTELDCVVLDLSKAEERELNIRLNKNTGDFDMDILANEFDIDELTDWGFKHIDLDINIDKLDENPYTDKVESPTYTASNEKPNVKELFDINKTNELIKKIKDSNIDKADKDFLIKSAQRHIVFNYSKIADYYVHSNKEVQELMEDSALIIIDFNKAIKQGYVRLNSEITDQYLEEYGSE